MKCFPAGFLFIAVLLASAGCRAPDARPGTARPIPIIDTHIHLWDTERPQGIDWPTREDKALYRPVLPEHFRDVAAENGVTAAVIVEASNRVEDNQWMLDLVRNDAKNFIGFVGSLPVGSPEFAGLLNELSGNPRFRGIRMRALPEQGLDNAAWIHLGMLAKKGLGLDLLIRQITLKDADAIAQRVPDLKIILDHVAGARQDGSLDPEWENELRKVARHPNVYCKISGIFEHSGQRPAPKELKHYQQSLDAAYKAFGEDRVVYGSNWPVTIPGGTYSEYKLIILTWISPKGRRVMEKFLHRNAARFYGVKLEPK